MNINKSWAALIASLCSAGTLVVADNMLSLDEIGQITSIIVMGAINMYVVWRTPNKDKNL